MATINSFKELIVYQKAYNLSMQVFEITKKFPSEEKYSLTDQIRRSPRSVVANITEAWARKTYPKSFVNKLTDSLGEEYETEVWLELSKDSGYISQEVFDTCVKGYDEVRKMLISMINSPEKFHLPNS